MLPKLQYSATHWMNGMKVTESHLVNQENFYLDQLRDHLAQRLTESDYGLLPSTLQQTSLDIEVNPEWIEVNQCRAVTAGGSRIEIWPGEIKELRMSTRQLLGNHSLPESSTWYVVLRVNPFERVPTGSIHPNEAPLRHPHTRPAYSLNIIQVDQVTPAEFSSFQLPLAKIQGSRGGLKVVEDYIPPCSRVDSHPDLLKYYREFNSRLQRIQNETFEVIDRLHQQQVAEGVLNPLAQTIQCLLEQITFFLASNQDYYRFNLLHQSPIHLVEWFVRFARTIQYTLRITKDRETFYEYCRKYLAVSPGEWDISLVDLSYNHLEVKDALNHINNFLELVEGRFLKKLSQLKIYTLTPDKVEEYDPIRKVKINPRSALPDGKGNTSKEENKFWLKSLSK